MLHIWEQFYSNIQETSSLEWISTLMQVASVWYAKKNNILVFPTGIVGVVVAAYMYFFMANPPLYADAVLNIYYLVMSVYGWYHWQQKHNESFVYPISRCSHQQLLNGLLLLTIGWIGIFLFLSRLTNSNTPVLDALVSSSAITSMWWMAKRKIENWHAWIFSNLVAIPLNFYKGFMLFSVMYILFLLLAVSGLMEWKKQLNATR